MKEIYLGDGLYLSNDDGIIRLRAPRESGDHEVFLDAEIFWLLCQQAQDIFGLEIEIKRKPTPEEAAPDEP